MPSSETLSGAVLKALDQAALLDAAERETWLRDLQQADPALASRVRSLIAGADSLGELDSGPALLADHLTEEHGALEPGQRLGAWQLVRLLGSGGMGRVYLAERADGAFEKQVAIKVLRRERRLPDAVIEHERALLARLEHPGLTRLLDGGISDEGNAFLVMEHVDGQTLDVWRSTSKPNISKRLDLFEQILDAVGHAHRQLVVHGDLKPNNIIVDKDERARVLDFGVARMLSTDLADSPRAVTPGWAAPECEAGAPPDVASDIYNLGQLLQHLAQANPATAHVGLPADLAAIVKQATEAEPDQRYPSVASLREDLGRFREHRPVDARKGGRTYRMRRFVRRHRLGTSFAAVVFSLLVVAGSVLAWQDRIVRSERDTARLAAARSQTVLDYLLGAFGRASQASGNNPIPVRTLLQDSLDHVDSDFSGDTAARQALLVRLSELLVRLNDFAGADKVLQRYQRDASADDPAQLRARVLDNRAIISLHAGKLDEAGKLARQGQLILSKVASDQRGQLSGLLVTEAQIQSKQGDTQAAIATLRRALSLRLAVSAPDSAQTVVVRNSLAIALMRSGQMAEALRQFRQLEAALKSSRREHSLDAATIYANHASTAFAYGRYREAERLFDKALKLQQKLYGPSASYAALLNNAGKLDLAQGDINTGGQRIQRAVAMMQQFAGANSIDAQLISLSLGQLALDRGKPAVARTIYREIGNTLAERLGTQHPLVARVRSTQLIARAEATAMTAGNPAFDRLLAQLAENPSNQRPHARLLCKRAELALAQKRHALARDSARACVRLRQQQLFANSPPLLIAHYLKATADYRIDRRDGPQHRKALLDALREQLGEDHPEVRLLAEL